VERFEEEWAAYCGTAYSVGVSDGTAALELALRALDIGPGDEVVVPTNTFVATWEAVAAVGATIVPVDVDPETLLITARGVEAALTERTAAVIPVHLFGQPADMDAINAVAKRWGIDVVEDAAQAHGATWRQKRAGSLGDVGCFSFYPGKNLGAFGDAGALVTNRAEVAERARSLANHGRARNAADRHVMVGDNRRLDALQAGVLSLKLPYLDAWNEARREAAAQYARALDGIPVRRVAVAAGAVSVYHLQVIETERRDEVRKALADEGISTGIHYSAPCHLQPAFAGYGAMRLPVAEAAAKRIVSLPMYPHLSRQDVRRVADALARALGAEGTRAPARVRSVQEPYLRLVKSNEGGDERPGAHQ
jgi:dTDP-4-amino-4,6-dideoxygalactose transaminase